VAVPNYDPAVASTTTILAGSIDRGIVKSNNNGTNVASANEGYYGKDMISLALGRSAISGYTLFAGVASAVSTDGVHTRFIPTIAALPNWIERPVASLFSTSVTALAADPTTSTIVFAGNSMNQFLRSNNTGVSWGAVSTPSPGIGSVHAIALDPRSCSSPPVSGPCVTGPLTTIYIGGDASLGATPGGNSASIYKSVNSGGSFSAASSGLTLSTAADSRLRITDIAIDPNNSQILYASIAIIGDGTRGNGASGIFKSTNAGFTWFASGTGLPLSAAGGGPTARADVWAIEIDRSDSNVLYAAVTDSLVNPGAVSGIYRSQNAGLNWTQIGPRRYAARDIAIDTNDSNRIFIGVTGNAANPGGVLRTVDGGQNWQVISNGLEAGGVFKLVQRGAQIFGATRTGVYSFFAGPDADLDNVETAVEDAAPNAGDLNGDGISDSAQSSTASFLIKTVGSSEEGGYRIPEGRTNYGNVDDTGTTEGERGGDGCTQLSNIYGIDSALYPADIGPSGIEYDTSDLGLVNIEYDNCSSATVDVTFDDGSFVDGLNWVWRNYSPTTPGDAGSFAWYTFAGAQRINSRTWRLTINANQLGVYRADSNSLLLRGGPAFFPERVLTSGFE
jgi:hypothetical protein